jgi:predicted ATPase
MSIHSISIKNYKSIRELTDFKLSSLNVLIGANGAGKSNFIGFFKFLNNIINQNLQFYINTTGRANSYLYFGQKKSSYLSGEIKFEHNLDKLKTNFEFKLTPSQFGELIFDFENSFYYKDDFETPSLLFSTSPGGYQESQVTNNAKFDGSYLNLILKAFKIFHFHDTSQTAYVKGFGNINDSDFLKEDGKNLAAFLYRISKTHPQQFNFIEKTIQSVAPFFHMFNLKPASDNNQEINLQWLEKGSDDYFDAHRLSDGTLRFICLATLLLQPDLPETIIIDEPELGLHPFAISKLAGLIKSASTKTQIIISTQSVELLNNFEPNDVIVVERENEQSVFKRLNNFELEAWLENYTLGELWNKNVLGGGPE